MFASWPTWTIMDRCTAVRKADEEEIQAVCFALNEEGVLKYIAWLDAKLDRMNQNR